MESFSPIHPPPLPAGLEWFNTPRPLALDELRGRVVILDFWTYCCINCMHVLPDLRYLEEKYPDSLAVIGLHTPKFPNERVGSQLQKAINRYDIRHPVASDPEFRVWREYGVRGWPTLVVIDPEGYVVSVIPGEGQREHLDALVSRLVREGEAQGILKREILSPGIQPELESYLMFPGKLFVYKDKLFISDSGHHRILHCLLDGRVEAIYGSGEAGFSDGGADQALFYSPQGLILVNDTLYVADTGNHALRAVDLKAHTVRTVAGTGGQGRRPGNHFGEPLQTTLNSPWDLACDNGQLYIAMAGPHQIWRMELGISTIGVFAGSGREDIVDGEAPASAFAQPSGLALAGNKLYVADSETSAIRAIDLISGQVQTLVGQGLFEFGDRDGPGSDALLQHPLGIAAGEGGRRLWVADSYNHKIKMLDIVSNVISSFDIAQELMEPGGLGISDGQLWIADTNHHRIVKADLATGEAEEVEIHE